MTDEEKPPIPAILPGPSMEKLESLRKIAKARFEESNQKQHDKGMPSIILGQEATHVQTTTQDKTVQQYLRRGRMLFHKFLREKGHPHETPFSDIDARDFVFWIFTFKPTWKSSTWRYTRQSVYRFIETYLDDGNNVHEAQAYLTQDAENRSRDSLSGNQKSRGTLHGTIKRSSSSLKMKKIPEKDFIRIIAWLRYKNRSQHAHALITWLKAGVLCGLRPSEWEMTELNIISDTRTLFGRRAWLYVICAKATNNRGFGVSRTLDLSSFNEEDLQCVKEMVEYGKKWHEAGTYAANQDSCAHLLARCVRTLWPRRKYGISLYSARHQAISNWKSSGMTKAEIAVMAGHASIMTASEKYGRRVSGWKNIRGMPAAVKEELHVAMEREAAMLDRNLQIKKAKPSMAIK